MSKDKAEVDLVLAAAEAAQDAANKARAKATHATAVVTVSQEALAIATKNAAEFHIAAAEAEKHALEEGAKARDALEKRLGLPSAQPQVKAPAAASVPEEVK